MNKRLPTVYSCSGCSSAAQAANFIALKLDRNGVAEMSCIAGVGGEVKPLVQIAKNSVFIVTIDGCSLKCSQACLNKHKLASNLPIVLSDYNVPKKLHQSFSEDKALEIYNIVENKILQKKLQQEND